MESDIVVDLDDKTHLKSSSSPLYPPSHHQPSSSHHNQPPPSTNQSSSSTTINLKKFTSLKLFISHVWKEVISLLFVGEMTKLLIIYCFCDLPSSSSSFKIGVEDENKMKSTTNDNNDHNHDDQFQLLPHPKTISLIQMLCQDNIIHLLPNILSLPCSLSHPQTAR